MPVCTKCEKDLDEEDFPLNGDGKGGRRKQCRKCMREINRQWRQNNKDKVRDYNRARKSKKLEKS
jgi:hypothetical protein